MTACSHQKSDVSSNSAGHDSAGNGDQTSDQGSNQDLNGNAVTPIKLAPSFTATNRDDTTRGQSDLTERPTVMWFYPAAGTYG